MIFLSCYWIILIILLCITYMYMYQYWSGKIEMGLIYYLMILTSLSCQLWTFFAFSGLDEETAHHGNREEAARQLCFYRKYREEGHHNVPEETKEVLQNRIDPNYGERERKTVHALLYTPGGEYFLWNSSTYDILYNFFLYLKDTYITGTAQHLLFPTGFETEYSVET